MTTIHLDPKLVPPHLASGYRGKFFRVMLCERVTIPSDAGLWDGGSRTTYHVIRLADGATVPAANHAAAPWADRRDNTIVLRPGFAVVQSSMFRGKDMGLTFHMLASDAAPLLPSPAPAMTEHERIVLEYTASRKASYGGRDRYQMYRDDAAPCWKPKPDNLMTRADWDAAKAALIERGYLNRAGAITVAGRNANESARAT